MKIACLGWGSLLWKSGPLRVRGDWRADGPEVSVEFCRVADGGELSTALCLNAPLLPVFWNLLDTDDLDDACRMLRAREQIPEQRTDGIGTLLVKQGHGGHLIPWAAARGLDAVIWTGLPPRFAGVENRLPSQEDAVRYLDGLQGETGEHARHYIQQVPRQLDTPYRAAIRRELGWQ